MLVGGTPFVRLITVRPLRAVRVPAHAALPGVVRVLQRFTPVAPCSVCEKISAASACLTSNREMRSFRQGKVECKLNSVSGGWPVAVHHRRCPKVGSIRMCPCHPFTSTGILLAIGHLATPGFTWHASWLELMGKLARFSIWISMQRCASTSPTVISQTYAPSCRPAGSIDRSRCGRANWPRQCAVWPMLNCVQSPD